VDIQIDGVSQLALARSQYLPVIKNKGFDDLIAGLQDKIDALAVDDVCEQVKTNESPASEQTPHPQQEKQVKDPDKSIFVTVVVDKTEGAVTMDNESEKPAEPPGEIVAADKSSDRRDSPQVHVTAEDNQKTSADMGQASVASTDNGSGVADDYDEQKTAELPVISAEVVDNDSDYDPFDEDESLNNQIRIADPIEPWNRIMFIFNDKFYFWAFKPVATGYNRLVPEKARVSVSNFFNNIGMPVRFVNTLLQGNVKGSGIELARFGINTTVGLLGFFDAAKKHCNLDSQDEDLGQTLGTYSIGNGVYIVWPFFGPSSLRDTVGMAGDGFLNPIGYVLGSTTMIYITSYDYLNDNSLRIDDYEGFKRDAIEPYSALRSAYIQNRQSKITK
jgi:phospholipid-binding lipoprotein MlaA